MTMAKSWPNAACWSPTDALAMVNIEAGTPDQASDINRGDHVFLAGHQAPAMQYLEEDDFQEDISGSPSSQEEVLAKLEDRSRSMLFITGAPGTGKSHLVRWLHIHAIADPEKGKRQKDLFAHVPRSMTNLADVLQVILEHADPKDRDEIRKKIATATGELKSDHALRERLLMTLATRLSELREEIERSPSDHQFGKRAYHEVLLLLPDFIASGAARALYRQDDGPAARIVRVRLQERSEGEDVADVQLRFTREDLLAGGKLAELEGGLLGKHDDECRARLLGESDFMDRALELLDYCVDGAVRELVGLDATQLQVAMGRLLTSLAERGQRLVLFFEDWGLIAGFQNQLAEAFAGATAQGSVLAVIAITKQRLGQFQGNILQRGWIYSLDRTPDEQRRAAVDDLIARNINAIRLGPKRLRAMFDARSDGTWITNACDECPLDATAACHSAFGSVEVEGIGKVGLFPMTSESITAALQRKFAGDRDLIPRIVLSGILRVVLEPRTAEELKAGTFPAARFADEFAPSIFRLERVELNIIERALSDKAPEQVERWTAFLETYRANTRLQSHSAAAAQALGLLPIPEIEPDESTNENPEREEQKGTRQSGRLQEVPTEPTLQRTATMDGALAFKQERQIASEDRLRNVVASAVRSAMPTDGRLNDEAWSDAPDGLDGNDIGLGSSSRSRRSLEIVLDAKTHGDALLSLVHLSEGGSWGQLDLSRDRRMNAEQAVDGWARDVERELLGERYRTDVAALLRLLLIMGIASDGVARVDARNAMDLALERAARSQTVAIPSDSLRDASVRALAREMLLRRVAFSQGRGAPVALDVATLWPILTEVLADLRLPTEQELPSTTPDEVLRALSSMAGDLEKRTTGLVKHLEAWWTVNGDDAPHLERIDELVAVEEQLSAQLPRHAAGQSQVIKDTITSIRKQRVEVGEQVRSAQSAGLLSLVLEIPDHVVSLQKASLAERLSLSVEFDRVRPLMTALQNYLIGVRTLVGAVDGKLAPGSTDEDRSQQRVPRPPLDRAVELARWAAQHGKKGARRGR
jgi:hypothetical protein